MDTQVRTRAVPPPVDPSSVDIESEMSAQTRFSPRMDKAGMQHVTICSIWPDPLISESMSRNGHGAWRYKIDAGSPDKPRYLRVEMAYDIVFDSSSPPDQPAEMTHKFIPANIEAAALIRFWAGDHPMNRHGMKGIRVIDGDLATPKEIAEMEKSQKAFLKAIISQADQRWQSADAKEIKKIGPEAKKAFELLNLDVKLHRWYSNTEQINLECPNCSESVKNTAIFCSGCRQPIAAYFVDRDLTPDPKLWPRVAEEVERLKKKAVKA